MVIKNQYFKFPRDQKISQKILGISLQVLYVALCIIHTYLITYGCPLQDAIMCVWLRVDPAEDQLYTSVVFPV